MDPGPGKPAGMTVDGGTVTRFQWVWCIRRRSQPIPGAGRASLRSKHEVPQKTPLTRSLLCGILGTGFSEDGSLQGGVYKVGKSRLAPSNSPKQCELVLVLSAAAARSATALPPATAFTCWSGRWFAWWGQDWCELVLWRRKRTGRVWTLGRVLVRGSVEIPFNIKTCFYPDVLEGYGVPGLTALYCWLDHLIYEGVSPYVRWARKRTLGRVMRVAISGLSA